MTFHISLARIDDRLIHGQITTTWMKELQVSEVIVVNDALANNAVHTFLLQQATPYNVTTQVVTVRELYQLYQSPLLENENVLLLFSHPIDVLRLISLGVPIQHLNIGSMSFSVGKQKVTNFIFVSKEERQVFEELLKLKLEIEIRQVPRDEKVFLNQLLKKESLFLS